MQLKAVIPALVFAACCSGAGAQDSTFTANYIAFRSLVDSLKTYSVFVAPYKSKDLYAISNAKKKLDGAYHFLRRKQEVSRDPDFVLVFLIDSLSLNDVTYEIVNKTRLDFRNSTDLSGKNADKSTSALVGNNLESVWVKTFHYTLALNVVVQTRKDKILLFPLDKNVYHASKTEDFLTHEQLLVPWCQLVVDNALDKYKNHYVDRVDW